MDWLPLAIAAIVYFKIVFFVCLGVHPCYKTFFSLSSNAVQNKLVCLSPPGLCRLVSFSQART
jgi:hypothetical protein